MGELKRTLRVFLAEDHQPDVTLIREALQAAGFEVALDLAENGERALHRLARYTPLDRPDVIILDLNLALVNGFAVLSALRSRPALARVPAAILTSSREKADREEAMRLGATAFISKPPDLDEFMRAVVTGVRELLKAGRSAEGRPVRTQWRCPRDSRTTLLRTGHLHRGALFGRNGEIKR